MMHLLLALKIVAQRNCVVRLLDWKQVEIVSNARLFLYLEALIHHLHFLNQRLLRYKSSHVENLVLVFETLSNIIKENVMVVSINIRV